MARLTTVASADYGDSPRKQMNLFTAINDALRVALETDDTAVGDRGAALRCGGAPLRWVSRLCVGAALLFVYVSDADAVVMPLPGRVAHATCRYYSVKTSRLVACFGAQWV